MIDISWELTIPIFYWDGFGLVTLVVALFLVYYLIRFIVALVTG